MKFSGLEGLRGIMCLWVIASHTVTLAGFEIYKNSGFGKLLANAGIAVDVFVILSGFVICLILSKQRENYFSFITRRAFRLFPIYLICLIVSILIVDISIAALQEMPIEHPKSIRRLEIFTHYQDSPVYHIGFHSLLLHGIVPNYLLPDTAFTIMGQAWSLTLELQFYLLAPLLIALLSKSVVRFAALAVFFLFIQDYIKEFMGHRSFFFAYTHYFIVGILSYFFYEQLIEKKNNFKELTFVITSIFSLAFVYIIFTKSFLGALGLFIWAYCYYSEVFEGYSSSFLGKVLMKPYDFFVRNKMVMYLGKISYSMYCSHMIFLYVISYILTSEGLINISNQTVYKYTMLIVPFMFTFFASHYSYLFIEKPFIKFGKVLIKK